MKQTKVYNIGLVGCGRISEKHIDAIKKIPNFKIVSICDNQTQNLNNVNIGNNVKKFTEFKDMILNVDLDAVSICTPNGLHAENTIFAAEKGINVICEKPIALDVNSAKKMFETCLKNKVNLMIILPFRKYRLIDLIKEKINMEAFGKIHLINLNIFWSRPQSYYDKALWRGTINLDGGILLNQVIHYIDLLYYLFDKPLSIQAFNKKYRNIETDDSSVINFKWAKDIIGSLNATMLTYPENLEDSLTIIGEKGTIKIKSLSKGIIEKWSFESIDDEIKNHNFIDDALNGHKSLYEDFYKELINNNYSYKTVTDSISVLDIVLSSMKSNIENKVINI